MEFSTQRVTRRLETSQWIWIIVAAIGVVCIFVGHRTDRITAPLGPSHDGNNAALYAIGGRAILEDGPIASRFGASIKTASGDRVVYAHHPPMAFLENAVAHIVPASSETQARLPAILSSVLAVALGGVLLHELGFRPGAAALALVVAFTTPMFFVFGSITEPLILSLPAMIGLTLLWQRVRIGAQTPAWVFVLVAALATLTSWEAALYAIVMGTALLVRRRRVGVYVLVGVAAGAVLTGLWIVWAYNGDLGDFMSRAVLRAGSNAEVPVTYRQMAAQQIRYFRDLFAFDWLVVPIAALGLFDRRTRMLVAASLGTVLAYGLLFRNGAHDHPYWLYCITLPMLMSVASVADRVGRWLMRDQRWRVIAYALGVGVIAVSLLSLWKPSQEEQRDRFGAKAGAFVRAAKWPANQRYAYHLAPGDVGPTSPDLLPWLLFYSRLEPYGVDGVRAVPRGQLVLVDDEEGLRLVQGEGNVTP
jgi:hypothetical protein